jgi:hypothetical protein
MTKTKTVQKLSTFLGLRDRVETSFKNMLTDMSNKFSKNQGLFQGEKKTYTPIEDYADDPSKRGYTAVASTVPEQLNYMKENTLDFFDVVFSIEKTNAKGLVESELIVDGVSWGTYTSLELLRLKTTLDNQLFKAVYNNVPTRSLTEHWTPTEDENYSGRAVFETPEDKGFSKTTLKTQYILLDPHPGKERAPQVATQDKQVNVGSYTSQKFSGAISTAQKAQMIKKCDSLYKAVITALENANDVEIQKSDLGSKVFEYIHS